MIEVAKGIVSYNLSLFLRPGTHFFYFIKGGKHYMLSRKYEKGLYKETNMQMNYIVIHDRDWRLPPMLAPRHVDWMEYEESSDDDSGFDKSKSIFKPFRLDTPHSLHRMFEHDFRICKVNKLVKEKEDYLSVKAVLSKHYPMIKNMFLATTVDSSYPNLSFNDYTLWCQKCNFVDKNHVNVASLDNIMIASMVRTDTARSIETGKGEMSRFEMLEVIVRVAMKKFKTEIMENEKKT